MGRPYCCSVWALYVQRLDYLSTTLLKCMCYSCKMCLKKKAQSNGSLSSGSSSTGKLLAENDVSIYGTHSVSTADACRRVTQGDWHLCLTRLRLCNIVCEWKPARDQTKTVHPTESSRSAVFQVALYELRTQLYHANAHLWGRGSPYVNVEILYTSTSSHQICVLYIENRRYIGDTADSGMGFNRLLKRKCAA